MDSFGHTCITFMVLAIPFFNHLFENIHIICCLDFFGKPFRISRSNGPGTIRARNYMVMPVML